MNPVLQKSKVLVVVVYVVCKYADKKKLDVEENDDDRDVCT